MYTSSGVLVYSQNPTKLIVEVDSEIARYYYSLVPKYVKLNKPMFTAHISVVRNIEPPNMQFWGKYQGVLIEFQYESFIYNDELYYWLNVYSLELEEIRMELGLKPFGDVTWSPDGRHKFHMTVGNLKNKAP